jgi:GrpB-like predicted nucleotidyltransferase (UPF0157 family)
MSIQVRVVPHDPQWAEMFARESACVKQALGSSVLAIHHIGSTAIPTIYAKAIIDMLVEVDDIQAIDDRNAAMASLGYEGLGEFGIPGRRYFRKDNPAGIRTHHVHFFAAGSPQVERHLAFRNFLLAHPDWSQRYSELKRQLVAAHPESIERYMDGKDAFIKEVDRLAVAWRGAFQ